MKKMTDIAAAICFTIVAGIVLAFIIAQLVGCVQIDRTIVPTPAPIQVDWESLADEPELVLGPGDQVLVQVSVASLKRALMVANQWDAFREVWPQVSAYILQLENGYEGVAIAIQKERAQLEWNAWVGAGVGAAGGVALGILIGFLVGLGQ
jgi:hypothetical protein